MRRASLNLSVIQVSIDILLMKSGFIGLILKLMNNKASVHITGSVLNLKVIYQRHNQFWAVQGNAPLLSALEAKWSPCLLSFYTINSSVMSGMQGVAKGECLGMRRKGSGQKCRELVYWVQSEALAMRFQILVWWIAEPLYLCSSASPRGPSLFYRNDRAYVIDGLEVKFVHTCIALERGSGNLFLIEFSTG